MEWDGDREGLEGYGMVWYGMVWYGVVWYGMVWYGMVWCAKACPVQRRSKGQGVCGKTGHQEAHAQRLGGVVWYGMVWCGMAWYGMVWCGMVWYGMIWYGVPRRAQCKGVPRVRAFQGPRRVWQNRQQGGTCTATLERTQAITVGERASKHGGWWERGLGQGLSAFLGMFN